MIVWKKNKLLFVSCCFVAISLMIFTLDAVFAYQAEKADSQVAQSFLSTFTSGTRTEGLHTAYLVAGGDIMLSRNIGYYNKKEGYDRIFWSGKYNPIVEFPSCTSENCLLFFNLESPFHPNDRDIQIGGFTFRANTGNVEVLRGLRTPFTSSSSWTEWRILVNIPTAVGTLRSEWQPISLLLSLANNHLVNGGYQGIETTQDYLHNENISWFGAGTTPEEANLITQYGFNDIDLCIQAYSYEGKENLTIGWKKITRNTLDEEQILQDIEEMKKLNCDVKILSLHRGAEYRLNPNKKQIELAHKFIDAGADLILGGHSHIPWKIEKYNGKYIFYSLGNFIFDQDRWKTASGREFDYIYDASLERKTVPTYIAMLAGLQLVKNGSGTQIILDQLHFDTMTKGVHEKLDEETSENLKKELLE